MATSAASVVWVDGEFVVDEPVPHDVQVRLGTVLGISPVAYVRGGSLLEAHVRTLGLAGAVLGYERFDASELMSLLSTLDGGVHAVSLVPTPESHRAMPPGTAWTFEIEPFEVEELQVEELAVEGLRLALGEFRRNQTSSAANVLLRDDAELWAGACSDPQNDATLWLDLDGHVACVDQHCLVVALDGRLRTPGLEHAALHTAWRHALLTGATVGDVAVTEAALTLDQVRAADAMACLTPWGGVHPVVSFDDRTYDVPASQRLAVSLTERLR